MPSKLQQQMLTELEALGLSRAEAQAYVALVKAGPLRAQVLAETLGVPRSSVYVTLRALTERGLVNTGEGYASKFRAAPPEEALPLMVDREREALQEREVIAKQVAERLAALAEPTDGLDEVVEVLRNRRVLAERFVKLQSEATDEIIGFAKAPVVATRGGNQGLLDALGRGVRIRSLYESAILDDPDVAPYICRWADAGEESRVYDGSLPFKLALFDGQTALMPLETPLETHALTSIVIRHPSLGVGLRMLFECLWGQSLPLQHPPN